MRIAVLEDDAAQTELIQSWFREAGHDCHAFAAGNEFKSALQHETFDLLVIDWNLPDTSGPDVLAWVRENLDWHIPVLFVTSRDHEEDIVFALEHGADDYMTKPVKRRETLARIAALEPQPARWRAGTLAQARAIRIRHRQPAGDDRREPG